MAARLTAIACVAALAFTALAEAGGPRIIRVPVSGKDDVAKIAKWGVEIIDVQKGSMTIAVPRGELVSAKAERALSRYPGTEIVFEDADEIFAPYQGGKGPGAYHTPVTAETEMRDLASRFPDLCTVQSIGKTCEQRDVWSLKITGQAQAPWGKPVFLFMGAHHSREWITVEVPLAIAKNLAENYATDPAVKKLVDSREIWIVPAVNPDGLNYSQTSSKYWRKNRRKNSDGSYGVDPNRNYGYKWGTAGDSGNPGSDTFRGTAAFSEPETQNIRDFAIAHNLTSSISYHSYGQKVFYPWSCQEDQTPDDALFKKHAQGMASINRYTPQQSVALYASSGDTDDYLYGTLGSCSFTYELASSFIPADSEIPSICDVNVKAARYLLDNCADPFPFVTHTPPQTASAGQPTPVVAKFDKAHHSAFEPVEVKLVVASGGQMQEIALAADPADPTVFKGEIPAAGSNAQPVEYFFGLKDKSGKLARCPRLSNFALPVKGAAPTENLFTLTGLGR